VEGDKKKLSFVLSIGRPSPAAAAAADPESLGALLCIVVVNE